MPLTMHLPITGSESTLDVSGLISFTFPFLLCNVATGTFKLHMQSRYISTGQRARGFAISPGLQAGWRSRDTLSIWGHSHSAASPLGSGIQKRLWLPRLDHAGAKGLQTLRSWEQAAGGCEH